MKNVFNKIQTILELRKNEEWRADNQHRADKYFHECGCSLGATHFWVGAGASLLYTIFFDHNFFLTLKNALFILMLSVTGKLIGIGIARVKLYLLYTRLNKQHEHDHELINT